MYVVRTASFHAFLSRIRGLVVSVHPVSSIFKGGFPNLLPEAEFNKQKEEAGEVGQICLLAGRSWVDSEVEIQEAWPFVTF